MAVAVKPTSICNVFFCCDRFAVVRDAQHLGGVRFDGAQGTLHDCVRGHSVELDAKKRYEWELVLTQIEAEEFQDRMKQVAVGRHLRRRGSFINSAMSGV